MKGPGEDGEPTKSIFGLIIKGMGEGTGRSADVDNGDSSDAVHNTSDDDADDGPDQAVVMLIGTASAMTTVKTLSSS